MGLCGWNYKTYSPRVRPSHSGISSFPRVKTGFPYLSEKEACQATRKTGSSKKTTSGGKKGVKRIENITEILDTLDYKVINAIGGMEIGRIHSNLMLGTLAFKKHRDVHNGHSQREKPKHPILVLALSGTSRHHSANTVTVSNHPCYQRWWHKCTEWSGGDWKILEEEKCKEYWEGHCPHLTKQKVIR